MIITMMADRYGHQKAIKEVQEQWLEDLLIFLGIDISLIHEVDGPTFRDYLKKEQVEIFEYLDLNALRVEYQHEVVGEWMPLTSKLERDEKGGLYYKIDIECWSIIEENIEIQ